MFVCALRSRGREIRDREIDQQERKKLEREGKRARCRTWIKLDKRTGFNNERWIEMGGKKYMKMKKKGQHPA